MPKREHPHLIPTPAALEQADEDRTLDAALQDAAREIADSLRREEQQQRQRRIVVSWIPILVVGLIAVIVGFSLPRTFQGRPAKDLRRSKNDSHRQPLRHPSCLNHRQRYVAPAAGL